MLGVRDRWSLWGSPVQTHSPDSCSQVEAGLWVPDHGFPTNQIPNLRTWALVFESEPLRLLGEASPYPCFLMPLPGSLSVGPVVQSDPPHPRSGRFYSRGDRDPELVMGVIRFLSGSLKTINPCILTHKPKARSDLTCCSFCASWLHSCPVLEKQVSFGHEDSWTCNQLISSSLSLAFALQKWQEQKGVMRKLTLKQLKALPALVTAESFL